MPAVSFFNPENIRKPKVSCCFQGIKKETSAEAATGGAL